MTCYRIVPLGLSVLLFSTCAVIRDDHFSLIHYHIALGVLKQAPLDRGVGAGSS